MGAQLLVDVVEMITKSLGADAQNLRNFVALFALSKHP
jgi:hypothetical protein